MVLRWDRGLAWYDPRLGCARSRVQFSPVPPNQSPVSHCYVSYRWTRLYKGYKRYWGKVRIKSSITEVFASRWEHS